MAQKLQKQQSKSPNKGSNNKDGKKDGKKPKNQKLTAQQLQQIQRQKIKNFFNTSLQRLNHGINISVVDDLIAQHIVLGDVKFSQNQKKIQNLLKPPVQQQPVKLTKQQMQYYQKQARRIQHLKLIANLNKQLVNKQPQQQIPYILTKQQHQSRMLKIIQQKKQRERRLNQIKESIRLKLQKEQKQLQEKHKQQKNQQKQKKRIQIQQKITKQKQQHIHFLSSDIKHRKDLEQVLNKVPLHVKMEQNFKTTIEMPQLEQKKLQYKELRQFKQRYSVDNIKNYQKEFNQKFKDRLQQSKMKKINTLSSIQQSGIKFPEKSQKLKSILAEQYQNIKKQLYSRDQYVQQKLKRQENYIKKLKQYKPKIDKSKRQQMQKRLLKQKQHLAKVGLQIDKRKVGLQYLGQAKKLAQKRKQELSDTMENSQQLSLRHKYKSQILLPTMKRSVSQQSNFDINRNTDFILKIRQKKLSKILNSQEEPQNKLKKLQIQAQKIQQVKKQKLGFLKHNFSQIASKQASNVALNSIKAKMNLIQLMKNH